MRKLAGVSYEPEDHLFDRLAAARVEGHAYRVSPL